MVKRAAETQLTKDSQENEEEEKQESIASLSNENSFTRASEEEIARRRVIKARRLRPVFSSENSALSTASIEEFQNSSQDSTSVVSNPFATVSLVPTTSTTQAKDESVSEDSKTKVIPENNSEVSKEQQLEASVESATKPREEGSVAEISSKSMKEDSSNSAIEANFTKEEKKASLSSVPRSFGGFSGGDIRMDQLAKQNKGLTSSSDNTKLFWQNAKETTPLAKSDSQVEANEGDDESEDIVDTTEVPIETKEPILPEQKTVTGEEDEENLFRIRGKLYSLEEKQWREKGVGQLRFNVRQEDNSWARFVMRAEGNLRVLLNFPIYSEFRIDRASEKSVRFCAPGDDGKPQSFLFRAFSKEDASKLETICVEWLQKLQQK